MKEIKIIEGFSKLSKKEKLKLVAAQFNDEEAIEKELKSFWHPDEDIQNKIDDFSENTITNYYFPYSIVPNVLINGQLYMVPMATEESSVVAAASKSAKYWLNRGGFHAEVINTHKVGQVHFIWHGNKLKLENNFSEFVKLLHLNTYHITCNMQKRGGGILDIKLVDMTSYKSGYYQLMVNFETCDSMGANFINTCLEEFAIVLKEYIQTSPHFDENERQVEVIMSILSNYTPDCIVKCWVECPVDQLTDIAPELSAKEFVRKFKNAIKIAEIDIYRATTHNKGIYNGIDAVIIATGNDFRAVEACGHAYASKNGKYTSLSHVTEENGMFRFELEVPMALGVVGGLTNLHPVVKRGLELLGNPSARDLMKIAAIMGLANNFAAVSSLTTVGIQKGHMKMHLQNILNHFNATPSEKDTAVKYFESKNVTFSTVREFLENFRNSSAEWTKEII